MKQSKPRTDFAILEHVSLTVSQISLDASGKQTVNRTYWSNRKKISQPDENSNNLMLNDSRVSGKNTCGDRQKEQKPVEKLTQLSLFPTSKQ